jgi:hypothetical protein
MTLLEQNRRRNKIGRNETCPCGSQRKYKKCCLNSAPVMKLKTKQSGIPASVLHHVQRMFDEQKKAGEQQLKRYGQVLPVISTHAFGQQIVGAGSTLLSSPGWKVFPDFLWDYLPFIFGDEWSAHENNQSESTYHPVSQWRSTILQHAKTLPVNNDGRAQSR